MRKTKYRPTFLVFKPKSARDIQTYNELFGWGFERIKNLRVAEALNSTGLITTEDLYYEVEEKSVSEVARDAEVEEDDLNIFYRRAKRTLPKEITGTTFRIIVHAPPINAHFDLAKPEQVSDSLSTFSLEYFKQKNVLRTIKASKKSLKRKRLDPKALILVDYIKETLGPKKYSRAKIRKKVFRKYKIPFSKRIRRQKRSKSSDSFHSLIDWHMPDIQMQGDRQTCGAISACTIAEHQISLTTGEGVDPLSQQLLHYRCKAKEADKHLGTQPSTLVDTVNNHGFAKYALWEYNSAYDSRNPNGTASADALEPRNSFFPVGCRFVDPPNQIEILKSWLQNGFAVGVAIELWGNCFTNLAAWKSGRIRTKSSRDQSKKDGHFGVIVGFKDTRKEVGGGHFIFRNSWGEDWGRECEYGRGYGKLPYQYIIDCCLAAFVVISKDSLLNDLQIYQRKAEVQS